MESHITVIGKSIVAFTRMETTSIKGGDLIEMIYPQTKKDYDSIDLEHPEHQAEYKALVKEVLTEQEKASYAIRYKVRKEWDIWMKQPDIPEYKMQGLTNSILIATLSDIGMIRVFGNKRVTERYIKKLGFRRFKKLVNNILKRERNT